MRAFITGITGQDGSYLAELLLSKDYEVHGLLRPASVFTTWRIDHILGNIYLHHGDVTDAGNIYRLLAEIMPDEIYHLAAQSHVARSFKIPEYTGDVDGLGTIRILDAMRSVCPDARFYQASSSEMFGDSPPPQDEQTPFRPRSPYAAAKVYAYWVVKNYREAYGLHASNGILFNHESPRRGETFVTRKISQGVARIAKGKQDKIVLGNLNAMRDWGYALEYVEAMWRMVRLPKPTDLVIATGETHSVKEFVREACLVAGIDEPPSHIETSLEYFRPTEVDLLCGNPTRAKAVLGWEPKVKFRELVRIMVEADMEGE